MSKKKAYPLECCCGHTDFFTENEVQKYCRICKRAVSAVKGGEAEMLKAVAFLHIPKNSENVSDIKFNYTFQVAGKGCSGPVYDYIVEGVVKKIEHLEDGCGKHEPYILVVGKQTVVTLSIAIYLKEGVVGKQQNILLENFDITRVYDGHIKI